MFRYGMDHLAFLEAGYSLFEPCKLTEKFNAYFGCSLSVGQIRSALRNHKIRSGRKTGGKPKGYSLLFSREQVRFIEDGYSRLKPRQLAAAVNEKFGLQIMPGQIKNFIKNHGILSGRTGCFQKGSKPWNTGTKGMGICKPNSGCFKKGNVAKNTRPIGSERICKKDGYILVKVQEKNPWTGVNGRWLAKHIIIWEAQNGPVPAGMVLRLIDGNPKNWAIENVELITMAENVRLNQLKLNKHPEELKETVRMLAKISATRGRRSREKRLSNSRATRGVEKITNVLVITDNEVHSGRIAAGKQ